MRESVAGPAAELDLVAGDGSLAAGILEDPDVDLQEDRKHFPEDCTDGLHYELHYDQTVAN